MDSRLRIDPRAVPQRLPDPCAEAAGRRATSSSDGGGGGGG